MPTGRVEGLDEFGQLLDLLTSLAAAIGFDVGDLVAHGPGDDASPMAARVGPDGYKVGGAEADEVGGVHSKGHVAIVPLAGEASVDIDVRKGHNAVEIEIDAFAPVGRVEGKGLAVPADAFPGQFAGVAVFIGVERAGDGPVVGQPNGLPGCVVEIHGLGPGQLAPGEAPGIVEAYRL